MSSKSPAVCMERVVNHFLKFPRPVKALWQSGFGGLTLPPGGPQVSEASSGVRPDRQTAATLRVPGVATVPGFAGESGNGPCVHGPFPNHTGRAKQGERVPHSWARSDPNGARITRNS